MSAISASRRGVVPSLPWMDSCPSHDDVGGLFFEFEVIRARPRPAQVRKERLEKVAKQKLENELDEIARLENCARIQRMHEFHRLQLLQKTQKDDLRFQQIKATRKQLVETRKRNAWESFMRKHHIREAMEQMKITGKFVSLDDIIDPTGSNRGSMSDEED